MSFAPNQIPQRPDELDTAPIADVRAFGATFINGKYVPFEQVEKSSDLLSDGEVVRQYGTHIDPWLVISSVLSPKNTKPEDVAEITRYIKAEQHWVQKLGELARETPGQQG